MKNVGKAFGLIAALAVTSAHAATYTWTPTTTGTLSWNTGANWDLSSAPNAAGDVANLTADLATTGTGASTVNLTTPITIGVLNIGDSGAGASAPYSVTGTGANTLTLRSNVGGGATFINVGATGTNSQNTISTAVVASGGPLTVTANGLQKLNFSNSLNVGSNALTLNTLSTVNVNSTTTTDATIQINALAGSGSLLKTGGGFVMLTGDGSGFTGAVEIQGGRIQLQGSTARLGTTSYTISGNAYSGVQNGGSFLEIGKSGAGGTAPGGAFAAGTTINLKGGGLVYSGVPGTVNGVETISQLNIDQGSNNIVVANASSGSSTINIGTISRLNNGTVSIRGNTSFGAGTGSGTSRIMVTGTAPAFTGNTSGTGINTPITAWIVGKADGVAATDVSSFMTYDNTLGFRILTASETSTSITAGSTANFKGTNIALTTDTTINSLVHNGASISSISTGTGTKTLTVASGGILFTGLAGGIASGTAGTGILNFGAAEGIVYAVSTNTNTISAQITGTGGFTKSGSGTLVLSGANNSTFGGTTTVNAGILRIGNASALTDSNAVVLANTSIVAPNVSTAPVVVTALDLNGNNLTIGSLAGGGSFGGNVTSGVAGSVILTTGGNNTSTTYGGAIVDGSGTVAVTKTGTGTMTFTGVNTYGGATTIAGGGTMFVTGAGSINNTSGISFSGTGNTFKYNSSVGLNRNVTLSSGNRFSYNSSANYTGTLGGSNGTLGGTNWNGAGIRGSGLNIGASQLFSRISPGNSPGTATTDATMTWSDGGSYLWEINSLTGTAGADPGWDLIAITGDLNTGGLSAGGFTLEIDSLNALTGWDNSVNQSWTIATVTGTINGFSNSNFNFDYSAFADQNALGGGSFSLQTSGANLNLVFTAAVVPEPSSFALMGVGLLAMGVVVRRRNRA